MAVIHVLDQVNTVHNLCIETARKGMLVLFLYDVFVELPLLLESLKVEWFTGGSSEHAERRPKKKMVLQLGGTTKVQCIVRHSWWTPCKVTKSGILWNTVLRHKNGTTSIEDLSPEEFDTAEASPASRTSRKLYLVKCGLALVVACVPAPCITFMSTLKRCLHGNLNYRSLNRIGQGGLNSGIAGTAFQCHANMRQFVLGRFSQKPQTGSEQSFWT